MSNVDLHAAALNTLLAPVRSWLDDPTVSEIMINGPAHVFVERAGKLEPVQAAFADAGDVLAALRNVAQFAGTFVDDERPLLEARLPDGSRLAAVLSPIAEGGPVVSIRKFSRTAFDLEALVAHDSLDAPTAALLRALVLGKCNVLVSGGTGSGKTSLLNVLTALVPERERVLVLEDTREIDTRRAHVVYLTARSADDFGRGAVTITQLFRTSLRMRPDRLVIGELRSGEALDLVQAMVSGHGGCLSTLHASHPEDALTRLETMCMMSEISVPLAAIRMQIGSGVHAIVQVDRASDGSRKITHVSAVAGYDHERSQYRVEDLITREYHGRDERGRLRSTLRATGAVPRFAERMRAQGIDTRALLRREVSVAFTKTKVWSVLPQTGEMPVVPQAGGPAYVPTPTRASQPRPSVPLPAEPAATRVHRQVAEHAHVLTAERPHAVAAEYRDAQLATRIAPLADLLAPEPATSAPALSRRSWTREILLAGSAFVLAGSATVALSMRSTEAHKPPPPPTLERAVAAALAAAPKAAVFAASAPSPTLAKNAERAAVDALASGDCAEAARRYGALARRFPERREFAEASRILGR